MPPGPTTKYRPVCANIGTVNAAMTALAHTAFHMPLERKPDIVFFQTAFQQFLHTIFHHARRAHHNRPRFRRKMFNLPNKIVWLQNQSCLSRHRPEFPSSVSTLLDHMTTCGPFIPIFQCMTKEQMLRRPKPDNQIQMT